MSALELHAVRVNKQSIDRYMIFILTKINQIHGLSVHSLLLSFIFYHHPTQYMLDRILSHKSVKLYIVLAGLFVTTAIVAQIIGGKIFSLEATLGFAPFDWSILGVDGLGFNLTTGVILWPIIFIMTDIVNEYFGVKRVKFLSYLTVGLILFAFAMIYGAIYVVPNEWWTSISGTHENLALSIDNMNLAFKKVMGQGLWIILGSTVAFLIGQIVDVFVFQRIRKLTGEKKVWLRATGSTLVSQFIDSYVVLLIAFWIGSDWELVRVLAIGSVNYVYKFGVAIILTPVIYLAHNIIDSYLGEKLAEEMKALASE